MSNQSQPEKNDHTHQPHSEPNQNTPQPNVPYQPPIAINSGMATASLVLGIIGLATGCLGIGIILGIIALILGFIARNEISASSGRLKGEGFALTGIILGIVSLVMIIPLLIGIMLPALGAARRTARQMQNNTQVRGIHQGIVIFAQSNRGYYPGLDSRGLDIGIRPDERFQLLLDSNYFTGEYAISPAETKTVWQGGPVTTNHFSYAMLSLSKPGERRNEWSETINGLAPIIGDRNTGSNPTSNISSIHTAPNSGEWRGTVGYNDTHVEFENTPLQTTKFGSGPTHNNDNLFTIDSYNHDDAFWVFDHK
ncbi:DUF4190 domain-containing protein [Poriferisphaera sp. WC338]|uniref:DUF4190 domain-containing protein n=1 Tax=Poriferisphaera sp. WC338 TaxID=3425129 RepID=UPI003D816C0E